MRRWEGLISGWSALDLLFVRLTLCTCRSALRSLLWRDEMLHGRSVEASLDIFITAMYDGIHNVLKYYYYRTTFTCHDEQPLFFFGIFYINMLANGDTILDPFYFWLFRCDGANSIWDGFPPPKQENGEKIGFVCEYESAPKMTQKHTHTEGGWEGWWVAPGMNVWLDSMHPGDGD